MVEPQPDFAAVLAQYGTEIPHSLLSDMTAHPPPAVGEVQLALLHVWVCHRWTYCEPNHSRFMGFTVGGADGLLAWLVCGRESETVRYLRASSEPRAKQVLAAIVRDAEEELADLPDFHADAVARTVKESLVRWKLALMESAGPGGATEAPPSEEAT